MNTLKGGEVINSGGFGCIFLPEIICKNKNGKKNKTKKITKMMLNHHANDEYNQIMKIKDIVKKIPNYGDYFVIKNIDICKIKKLTDADLKHYTEKCTALQKYNITKKNIHKSFNKISIVNIPYAGISLDKFIENNFTIQKIKHLNNLLIQLLKNAIIPMNNLGVYHSDIKSSNILINESFKKVRFIDWGLTVIHPKKYFHEIPSKWKNRPFQFNVPFEIVLFTDDFVLKMNNLIKSDNGVNDETKLFNFVNDYIYFWLNERGKGHISYIHNILNMLGIINSNELDMNAISSSKTFTKTKQKYVAEFAKYKNTIDYITNYIVFILANFTEFDDNGSFTMLNYINKIFKNTIDVWGFIITYIPILEIMHENKSSLDDSHKIIFFSLQQILIKYCYTPQTKMLNVKNLSKELTQINTSLNEFSKNENISLDENVESHINTTTITETPESIL